LEWGIQSPLYHPVPLMWPPGLLYPTDPLSQRLYDRLERNVRPQDRDVMLCAMGNQVVRQPNAQTMTEIAVIFCEANPLPESEYRKLADFRAVITGSDWNHRLLCDRGLFCQRVMQGVDTDLFRYQAKRRFRDRFVVFSGGQLVYRKGQDLLLKAFSIFAQRHADALLITTWRAPWEGREITSSINAARICRPFVPETDMHQAIVNWILANGVAENQFIALGPVANRLMPEVYRESDLAVFPNRCEGGTNLVAMEALSSGVRCAISANTGHLDIIYRDNCIPLLRQKPITDGLNARMLEWGESDVEEILDVMQRAYDGTLPLNVADIRGSMHQHTWENTISQLLTEVEILQG
jgi:glycosyltransferase involved in cell wall biosynthesis